MIGAIALRRGGSCAAIAALVLAGCAAPATPAASPATPAPPTSVAPERPPGGGSDGTRKDVEKSADDREEHEERDGPAVAIAHAKHDIDVAERELLASAGDCAVACRALGSMQRAAAHLCALARDDDDQRRCEDAKREVLEARDRVRSTCTDCAAGPSLDKNAPPFGVP